MILIEKKIYILIFKHIELNMKCFFFFFSASWTLDHTVTTKNQPSNIVQNFLKTSGLEKNVERETEVV